MPFKYFLRAIFISVIIAIYSSPARALDKKVTCTVLTIHASNYKLDPDESLKDYMAIFKKKPFSKFNSFKLASRIDYKVILNTPVTLKMPDNMTGSIKLESMDKKKFILELRLAKNEINRVNMKITAGPAAPVFIAGFTGKYAKRDGKWIFAVMCKTNGNK